MLGVALCLAACGGGEQRVYDVDSNPDNYPELAIDLLRDVEAGELDGAAAITEEFGELYTEHPELLDHAKWTRVIERLGTRFETRADSLVAAGLANFTKAADYYQLASFARPTDRPLRHRARQFDTWARADVASEIDLSPLKDTTTSDLAAILDAVRYFALADQLHFQMLDQHIVKPLRDHLRSTGRLSNEVLAELSPVDRALASCCGLVDDAPESLTSFGDPTVELLGARVRQLDTVWYAAEAYVRPLVEPTTPMEVVLELRSSGETGGAGALTIVDPESAWTRDRIMAVRGVFQFEGEVDEARLGVFEGAGDTVLQIPRVDDEDGFYPIELTFLEAQGR